MIFQKSKIYNQNYIQFFELRKIYSKITILVAIAPNRVVFAIFERIVDEF